MEKTVEATKHWFRVSETTWQLLVEFDGHILSKTVIIYNPAGSYKNLLATNKKIKENDLIERAWTEYGIKLKLI
jgi:hypothetical protein